jgi:CSLREA domain-containing protein
VNGLVAVALFSVIGAPTAIGPSPGASAATQPEDRGGGLAATWTPISQAANEITMAINDDGDQLRVVDIAQPSARIYSKQLSGPDVVFDHERANRFHSEFVTGGGFTVDRLAVSYELTGQCCEVVLGVWNAVTGGEPTVIRSPNGGAGIVRMFDMNAGGSIVGLLDGQATEWSRDGVATPLAGADEVYRIADNGSKLVRLPGEPDRLGIMRGTTITPIPSPSFRAEIEGTPDLDESGDVVYHARDLDDLSRPARPVYWHGGQLVPFPAGHLFVAFTKVGLLTFGTTSQQYGLTLWPDGDVDPVSLEVLLGLNQAAEYLWYSAAPTTGGVPIDMNDRCQFLASRYDRATLTERPGIVTLAPCGGSQALVVNSTADRTDDDLEDDACDTGRAVEGVPECTLRAAIQTANQRGGSATVTFAIPGEGTPRISPRSALPVLEVPVDLDGTSQAGGWVELSGGRRQLTGLELRGGTSRVRGLVVNGFGRVGLVLADGGGNTVSGNRIGTDVAGRRAVPNGAGVVIRNSSDNVIGGVGRNDGNVISGNQARRNASANGGVVVAGGSSRRNRIEGNVIGLGTDGDFLENSAGVVVGGRDNVVGVSADGPARARNRIAAGVGVLVLGSGNRIAGNSIGLNRAGRRVSGDGLLGVWIVGGDQNLVTGNTIAGHLFDVDVLSVDGQRRDPATENRVLGNVIGLVASGASVPAGGGCTRGSFGVRVDGAPGTEVARNRIAGHAWDVVVTGVRQLGLDVDEEADRCRLAYGTPDAPFAGTDVLGKDVVIEDNTVGLLVGGRPPSGFEPRAGVTVYGRAERVRITRNTVSGHATDIRLDNGKAIQVDGNIVVARQRDRGPEVGIDVFRASAVTIDGNTVGGHQLVEVALRGGSDHVVIANQLGSIGNTPGPSLVGLLVRDTNDVRIGGRQPGLRNVISGNGKAILIEGQARVTSIIGNRIGTNAAGTAVVGNLVGIDVAREAVGVFLTGNLISGNAVAGAIVAADARLEANRIGPSVGTRLLGNGDGVRVTGGRAFLGENTVAGNDRGIVVSSREPVTITGGPIYANRDRRGIRYEGSTLPVIRTIRGMRTAAGAPRAGVHLGVRVPGTGPQTVEFYGNPNCADPEGRIPIGRHEGTGGESLVVFVPQEQFAALGEIGAVTATLTTPDARTSPFSTCEPVERHRDGDGDGASDLFETFGANNGDADNDGTRDALQNRVATLYTDRGFVSIAVRRGQSVEGAGVAAHPLLPGARYGAISFSVAGVDPGERVTINVLTHRAPGDDERYGLVVPGEGGAPVLVLLAEPVGARDGATRTGDGWQLRITDGGPNDADGTADGRITLLGGPTGG